MYRERERYTKIYIYIYTERERENCHPHPHHRAPCMKFVEGSIRPIYTYRPRKYCHTGAVIVGVGGEVFGSDQNLCPPHDDMLTHTS